MRGKKEYLLSSQPIRDPNALRAWAARKPSGNGPGVLLGLARAGMLLIFSHPQGVWPSPARNEKEKTVGRILLYSWEGDFSGISEKTKEELDVNDLMGSCPRQIKLCFAFFSSSEIIFRALMLTSFPPLVPFNPLKWASVAMRASPSEHGR